MSLRAIAVGSGWGAHAARAFASDPRVELAGLVGRGSERTRALAGELRVQVYTNMRDAIEGARPRLAAVAVSERLHPDLVEQLLESDCHVLCAHPIAPGPERVLDLAGAARRRGLLAAADYTLRLTPAYEALRTALGRSGPLLRAHIESPGRALVMAMDLAIGLAGPVARVVAAPDYPPELEARRRLRPRAFPPSFLLAHRSGCVTSIVPVPHADPRAAHRVTLSAERARIDAALPSGEVRLVQSLAGGAHREHIERAASPCVSAAETFGVPMRALARRFVDAVTGEAAPHAPLEEEAIVRATWVAAQESARSGAWVAPRGLEG